MFKDYLISMVGSEKAEEILSMTPQEKKTKFIMVVGPQKPTGKTTLKQVLREHGYQALEPFEGIEVVLSEELQHPLPGFGHLVN